MKIVAMLRVKNEARWIAEVLASIQPLTRDIVILDDHSTDDTAAICTAAHAAVIRSPFPDGDVNEVRDKNYLLPVVREMKPDYVLAIDGDEILDPGSVAKIREALDPRRCQYSFRVKYLWNDRHHVRMDGVYGRFERASMFSLVDQPAKLHFRGTGYGGNFHCGNVPAGLRGVGFAPGAALLHLGYMHQEDRLRKYEWYRKIDPGNTYEDGYRHMVIGDVFPPESKFLHGGPLKIWSIGNPPQSS